MQSPTRTTLKSGRAFRQVRGAAAKLALVATGFLIAACDSRKSNLSRDQPLKNEVLASKMRIAPKLRAKDGSVCIENAILSELRDGLFEGLGGNRALKEGYFKAGGLKLSEVRVENINPKEHHVTCSAVTVLAGRSTKIDFDILIAAERPQLSFAIDGSDQDLTADLKQRLSKSAI
jgi:hypothetical protein